MAREDIPAFTSTHRGGFAAHISSAIRVFCLAFLIRRIRLYREGGSIVARQGRLLYAIDANTMYGGCRP